MGRAAERCGERGWTLLEVLLVLVMVTLLLALALPNFHSARIRNDETAAVRALREVGKAQELFRSAALIDEDSDGRGEYAFLRELSGARVPRTFVPGSGGAGGGPPAPLPQFKFPPGGVEAELCGYRFALWLPGAAGAGVQEGEGAAAPGTVPRLANLVWCAYAWPVRRGGWIPAATGTRTFFANQTGEVLASEGEYSGRPWGDGKPAKVPDAAAAFLGPGPAGLITGALAAGTVGRDGLVWSLVK